MRKSIPWVVAGSCILIAVWAVGTRHSIIRLVADRIEKQEEQITQLQHQRRQDEELRATHASSERILAQQEKRLHEVYTNLVSFELVHANMMLSPGFEMTVVPHVRSADVVIKIGNASPDQAWWPPRYKIGFLNADGFVSGQIDSGRFETWVQPGTNLTHQYRVSFDFGEPVYCTVETMRQGSRNP